MQIKRHFNSYDTFYYNNQKETSKEFCLRNILIPMLPFIIIIIKKEQVNKFV